MYVREIHGCVRIIAEKFNRYVFVTYTRNSKLKGAKSR